MKPLVIYHNNCADGFGAAFAAWLKFGDEAEYLPMDYMKTGGKTDTDLILEFSTKKIPGAAIRTREVYILDFSLPKPVMEWVLGICPRVVWLDHHKTAFEMWCGEYHKGVQYDSGPESPDIRYDHHILLDDNKSGAMLAWEYFHPGTKVPMLIRHIDDYDRYQFEIPGTREFSAALRSYKPWSFWQWQSLLRETHVPYGGASSYMTDFMNQGHAILRAHDQNVQAVLKQARKCRIPNFNVDADIVADHREDWELPYEQALVEMAETYAFPGLAANAPAFLASDLGHELALKSGTFGLVWYIASDLQVHCSLRSNGDYDVSAIAKAFGGGGHRNAAGFSTDIDTLLEWLK